MAGDAGAGALSGAVPARAASRPEAPGPAETILWEGRPSIGAGRLFEGLFLLILLGVLAFAAMLLIAPHLGGSTFAGAPDAGSLPLILLMVMGTVLIIALPVWLRSTARGRARYMLTNRRALVWVGRSVAGEAILFGSEMTVTPTGVHFWAHGLYLDWRLRDEGPDLVRFERLLRPEEVAAIAEGQGARRMDLPDPPQAP